MNIILEVHAETARSTAALSAAASCSLTRDLQLTLVGDAPQITAELARRAHNPARIAVQHAEPSETTSEAVALLARQNGAAMVGLGQRSTLLHAAETHLTLIPGVARPAMCAVYPTARRRGQAQDPFVLILDIGASYDADADDLASYARMGAAYASNISRNDRPRVALLSGQLGPDLEPEHLQAVVQRLHGDESLECIGTIGGHDITQGAADVIVCAGGVGNIVTGLLAGVGAVARHLVTSFKDQGLRKRIALQTISKEFEDITRITDWKEYGGAPLLGYGRPIIVTEHGANADTVERALRLAAKTVRTDIVGAIQRAQR